MTEGVMKTARGFGVHLMVFCPCGWLMQDCESGTYCVNSECGLRTRLFEVSVKIDEIPLPKGAAA
jgi:hypothetical protein